MSNDNQAQVSNTTKSAKTRDLVFMRVFDAPVEQVWKAWSSLKVDFPDLRSTNG
jgi:hypothetical protein